MLHYPKEGTLLTKELLPHRPLISEYLVKDCINQINEYDGLRSCRLTSQLNAFILTSQINKQEAQQIQNELCFGIMGIGNWRKLSGGRSGFGWAANIEETASCIKFLTGKEVVGYARPFDGDISTVMSDLEKGWCAVVSNWHTRTIFKTIEGDGDYYVQDPLMDTYEGYYNLEEVDWDRREFLDSIQTEPYYFIV